MTNLNLKNHLSLSTKACFAAIARPTNSRQRMQNNSRDQRDQQKKKCKNCKICGSKCALVQPSANSLLMLQPRTIRKTNNNCSIGQIEVSPHRPLGEACCNPLPQHPVVYGGQALWHLEQQI